MARPKWSELQYACTRLDVGRFRLSANWSSDRLRPGYNVGVAMTEFRGSDPFPDWESAQAGAIVLARKILHDALDALDTYQAALTGGRHG